MCQVACLDKEIGRSKRSMFPVYARLHGVDACSFQWYKTKGQSLIPSGMSLAPARKEHSIRHDEKTATLQPMDLQT